MSDILERLAGTIEARKGADPEKSYVARLLAADEDAVLKKIGEEATETVLAAKGGDRLHLVRETADHGAPGVCTSDRKLQNPPVSE